VPTGFNVTVVENPNRSRISANSRSCIRCSFAHNRSEVRYNATSPITPKSTSISSPRPVCCVNQWCVASSDPGFAIRPEQFIDPQTQRRPLLLRDGEVATEVHQRGLTDLAAVAFGLHQAMRLVTLAGAGTACLRAADEHDGGTTASRSTLQTKNTSYGTTNRARNPIIIKSIGYRQRPTEISRGGRKSGKLGSNTQHFQEIPSTKCCRKLLQRNFPIPIACL